MTPFGAEISHRDLDGQVSSWWISAGDPNQPIPRSQDGIVVVVEAGRMDVPAERLGIDVLEVATIANWHATSDSATYRARAYRQEFLLFLSFEGNEGKLFVSANYNRNGCRVSLSAAIAIARRPESRFKNGKEITRAQWAWVARRAKKQFAKSPWSGWRDFYLGI